MVMNGYDTDGDGGNNFYTVNGKSFYYTKYPITVRRSETVRIYLANLTEFDLINSFHLHGEFFRSPADRDRRPLGVHGHRRPVSGAARSPRDRLHAHRPVHVPRAPVGVHRPRLDGLLQRDRLMEAKAERRGDLSWRLWALVPILLLAVAVGGYVASGSSLAGLIGSNPAAGGRVRHSPGRVQAGRDPGPGDESAAGRPDDRLHHRRRCDRPVLGRRASDSRPAALEHGRHSLRLDSRRPDLPSG